MAAIETPCDAKAHNTKFDWNIDDVELVCIRYGLRCDPPHGAGSHYVVSCPHLQEMLTIRSSHGLKPVYIRAFVGFVKKSREGETE